MLKTLQPDGWAKPAGYANGISARGRVIHVAGQIGWNKDSKFETDDFVGQVKQSLQNVVAVLACDDARPEHIVSMTWYFTNKREYLENLKGVGQAYREMQLQASMLSYHNAFVVLSVLIFVLVPLPFVMRLPKARPKAAPEAAGH